MEPKRADGAYTEVVEPTGRFTLRCEPGYYSKIAREPFASENSSCKDGVKHTKVGLCLACIRRGEIDLSPKQTSMTYAATETGVRAKEFTSKLEFRNIVEKDNDEVDACDLISL